MPAVGDYLNTLTDRLWALLEADATWAGLVDPTNRIKYHEGKRDPEDDRGVSAGKVPACGIYPTDFAGFQVGRPAPGVPVTFCRDVPWTTQPLVTFAIEYRLYDMDFADATNLMTRTEFVLAKAGSNLASATPLLEGLAFLKGWGPVRGVFIKGRSGDKAVQGRKRVGVRMFVPFEFVFKKSDILG